MQAQAESVAATDRRPDGLVAIQNLLACPVCHAALAPEGGAIRCAGCAARYAVDDGVALLALSGTSGTWGEPQQAQQSEDYQAEYQTIERAAAYNLGYQRKAHKRFGTRHEWRLIRRHLGRVGHSRVILELPCGGGRITPAFADATDFIIEADIAIGQIRYNRATSTVTTPRAWMTASAFHIPLRDAAVDGALCIRLAHHLPTTAERERLLRELMRVSKRFVIVTFFDHFSLKNLTRRLRHPFNRKPPKLTMTTEQVAELARAGGSRLVAAPPLNRVASGHRFALIVKTAPGDHGNPGLRRRGPRQGRAANTDLDGADAGLQAPGAALVHTLTRRTRVQAPIVPARLRHSLPGGPLFEIARRTHKCGSVHGAMFVSNILVRRSDSPGYGRDRNCPVAKHRRHRPTDMGVALFDVAAQLRAVSGAVTAAPPAATVTVVLPTYNERENIVAAVEAIRAAFATHRWEWEILVVDDDSPDHTWELVERLGDPRVRCYRRLDRKGLSSAIVDGLSLGRGDRLVVADADLQHDLARIPDLVAALDRHPLAVGTRYVAGGGTAGLSRRRLGLSRMATVACQVMLGIRCSDPMSGFFAIRRAAFQELVPRLNPRGYKLLMEILHTLPPSSVAEVPYVFSRRRAGDSKLLPQVIWDFALSLLELLSRQLVSARFAKYAVVGLSGVVVQYATFYKLWRQVLTDEPATAAAIASAACSNYLINNWWTFSDRRHRGGEILHGLLLFCLISGAGALINQAMTWYLHDRHQIDLVLTMAAGIAVATVWNYFLNLDLTWRGHARPE